MLKQLFLIFKNFFKKKKKVSNPIIIKETNVLKGVDNKSYYTIIKAEDIPDIINNGFVYVVGENGYEWLAAFKCPCGCNDIIYLNLLKDAQPFWSIIIHKDNTFSISPSIKRIVNCKSHFNIKNSRLNWWMGD